MSDRKKTSSCEAVHGGSPIEHVPNEHGKVKPSQTSGPSIGTTHPSTPDGHPTEPAVDPRGERQHTKASVSPMMERWVAGNGRQEPWSTVAVLNAPSSVRDPIRAELAQPSRRAKTV